MRRLPHLINNRNHREQVHKRLSTLPIVDQTNLRLRLRVDTILQVQNRTVVAVLALDARGHSAIWRLQEPAVLADDLVLGVARQALEAFGRVLDGAVVHFGVAHHEGAGEIHGADVDLRVWSVCDFDLSEKIRLVDTS